MDYTLPTPSNKPTFPEPLPSYLPRTVRVPVAILPTRDPVSANAGRFSLSMKGMRKELRRAGGRAEALVLDVEAEMMTWLQGGVILRPDESNATGLANLQLGMREGREIGSTGTVREVSRTPLQLVWSIADDAFARYVVHCCARYHDIVSFSRSPWAPVLTRSSLYCVTLGKGDSNERLTYLLRPNVRQPDYRAAITLETPPATDMDYSSQPDTTDVDSDFISDRDLIDSDVEEPTPAPQPTTVSVVTGTLESIQEDSLPSSPIAVRRMAGSIGSLREDDEWSILSGDADGDESDSGTGQGLADSLASLDLGHNHTPERGAFDEQDADPDKTLTQDATNSVREILAESKETRPTRMSHYEQPMSLSNRRWIRSASSPSRSPARTRRLRNQRKRRAAAGLRAGNIIKHTSFYDYLFL